MRTIDADALIAHINECIDVQNDNWEFERAIGLTVALECISDAPTIEPEQRWIPVSERPPEEDGMYYVTVRDSKGDIDAVPCLWFSDKWGINGFEVIAWIKIPEPYKGEYE